MAWWPPLANMQACGASRRLHMQPREQSALATRPAFGSCRPSDSFAHAARTAPHVLYDLASTPLLSCVMVCTAAVTAKYYLLPARTANLG